MDRREVYPGQVLPETVLLNMAKDAMIGLAKLSRAVIGTATQINGLLCVPDSPASLNVSVGAGEIYALKNIDDTAYSSLVADTTHTIVKQGIRLDASLLSCPAPVTSGQSINYLIQVTYTETDSGSTVLPYYNASNPASAWSGPANSGTAQNTVRQGVCTVAVKAGTSATTGTQTTPSPDSGYVGAWVVTVANGATTIVSGNISIYPGAPFISRGFNSVKITTSGNFTTPANINGGTVFKITLVGGGAGGGGGTALGGGGGPGGCVTFYISGLAASTAYAVVIGPGGAGGASPSAGVVGGTTQVTINSVVYSVAGGLLGGGDAGPNNKTSDPGVPSATVLALQNVVFLPTAVPHGMVVSGVYNGCPGGSTPFGTGGAGGDSTGSAAGSVGSGYGAGGGGGVGGNGGAAGTAGLFLAEWVA